MFSKKIIEDAMNEIYVFDSNTLKFVFYNKASLANLGYSPEEMLELTPIDIKPEFTLETFNSQVLNPLREGKSCIEFTTVHKRKDGSIYDVNVKLQYINDEEGSVFAAIIEDITERVAIQQELEKYKDHLEELVEVRTEELHAVMEMYKTLAKMSPVAIMRTNKHGACEFTNKKWSTLTNQSREESLGWGWLKAIHEEDRNKVEALWQSSVLDEQDFSEEFRVVDKSGNIFWVLCSGNAVNGGNTGHVITLTNITKRKEILPQLLSLQKTIKTESIKRSSING